MSNIVPGDGLTHIGAARLAAKIRAYWDKRGRKVEVWVEEEHFAAGKAQGIQPMHVVRSDMINGLPR